MRMYEGHDWIRVKRYVDDESLSWEGRYRALKKHHEAETTFLIHLIRDIGNPSEIETIISIIGHPAGFQVELFGGLLSTYRLEDGRYVVDIENEHGEHQGQNVYDDPRPAAQFFVVARRQWQLGYDHEAMPNPRRG